MIWTFGNDDYVLQRVCVPMMSGIVEWDNGNEMNFLVKFYTLLMSALQRKWERECMECIYRKRGGESALQQKRMMKQQEKDK